MVRIGVGRGTRGAAHRHGIHLLETASAPAVGYCLLLEDGFHILLEDGTGCIATQDYPRPASGLLLQDGFAMLLESDDRIELEG